MGAGSPQVQRIAGPVATVAAAVMLPVMAGPVEWMVEFTVVGAKIWLALR